MAKRKQSKRKFGGVPSVSNSMINLFSKAVYRGTMMFPLAGAENEEHFNKTTEYTGDFTNARARNEIFKFPRRYSFSIVLIPSNGKYEDVDIDEYDLPDDGGVTHYQLAELIKQYCKEQIENAPADSYDLAKSVVIIQLYHTKAELDYAAIIAKRLQVAESAKTYIVEDVA